MKTLQPYACQYFTFEYNIFLLIDMYLLPSFEYWYSGHIGAQFLDMCFCNALSDIVERYNVTALIGSDESFGPLKK